MWCLNPSRGVDVLPEYLYLRPLSWPVLNDLIEPSH